MRSVRRERPFARHAARRPPLGGRALPYARAARRSRPSTSLAAGRRGRFARDPSGVGLQREFYRATGTAPGAQAVQDALGVLEGRAHFERNEEPVHTRLAERDGAIYLDLADDDWNAVEITSAEWRIVRNPPVRFRRPAGMLPLPTPVAGGTLDDLRASVNASDDDWRLVVAWIVAALRPRGPYPVLPLHGKQGAAKSTTARVLRSLVDPNAVPCTGTRARSATS